MNFENIQPESEDIAGWAWNRPARVWVRRRAAALGAPAILFLLWIAVSWAARTASSGLNSPKRAGRHAAWQSMSAPSILFVNCWMPKKVAMDVDNTTVGRVRFVRVAGGETAGEGACSAGPGLSAPESSGTVLVVGSVSAAAPAPVLECGVTFSAEGGDIAANAGVVLSRSGTCRAEDVMEPGKGEVTIRGSARGLAESAAPGTVVVSGSLCGVIRFVARY